MKVPRPPKKGTAAWHAKQPKKPRPTFGVLPLRELIRLSGVPYKDGKVG